jgi:adenylate cyclase
MVGTIGSSTRLHYTAIGVAVETSLALARLGHRYGVRALITDSVHRQVQGEFVCRLLDRLRLGEGQDAVGLYELVSEQGRPVSGDTLQYNQVYELGFSHYRNRRWDEALAIFEQLSRQRPEDRAVEVLSARCRSFRSGKLDADALPDDWDGAITMNLL